MNETTHRGIMKKNLERMKIGIKIICRNNERDNTERKKFRDKLN